MCSVVFAVICRIHLNDFYMYCKYIFYIFPGHIFCLIHLLQKARRRLFLPSALEWGFDHSSIMQAARPRTPMHFIIPLSIQPQSFSAKRK